MRMLHFLALIGVVSCLGSAPPINGQQEEPPYTIPTFEIGSTAAAPGQSSLRLPLSVSFEDGQLVGWTVLVQYDPSAVVATAIEDALHAEFFQIIFPHDFATPGNIGAAAVYNLVSGSPILPVQSGVVGFVHLCILSSATPGAYVVSIGDTAPLAAGGNLDQWMTRYGLEVSGVGYSDMPIAVPGQIQVSGAPIAETACRASEPPVPPPDPQVRFEFQAPGSVTVGARFQAQFQIASDTPLLGIVAAIDVDETVLSFQRLQVLSQWTTPDAYVYANVTEETGQIGLGLIPDLIGLQARIPAGTTPIASMDFQVDPTTLATSTEIRFVESIAQWIKDEEGEWVRLVLRNSASADPNTPLDPKEMNLQIPVMDTVGAKLAIRRSAPFLRGDANRNGKLAIADSVMLLNHLFLGGPEPPCLDAADATDDGTLNLSDPIRTLQYLFLAGSALPPPSETPGEDPTPDELGCEK